MPSYFVTGVSSGIGRGMVRELVRRGHRVWGIARREDHLLELQKTLDSDCFSFSVCDLEQDEQVRSTAARMEESGFRPDVVILNAGINPERLGSPFTSDGFEEVVRVNLFGAMRWVDVFVPNFRERGTGHFVAISSLAAFRGDARWIAYCASKAALTRAFEALRGRYSREGITFTTIHLGAVDTGMGSGSSSWFRLTSEQAVYRILAAVDRRALSVTMPRVLRLILEAMRILPDAIFSRIVAGAFTDKDE